MPFSSLPFSRPKRSMAFVMPSETIGMSTLPVCMMRSVTPYSASVRMLV